MIAAEADATACGLSIAADGSDAVNARLNFLRFALVVDGADAVNRRAQ